MPKRPDRSIIVASLAQEDTNLQGMPSGLRTVKCIQTLYCYDFYKTISKKLGNCSTLLGLSPILFSLTVWRTTKTKQMDIKDCCEEMEDHLDPDYSGFVKTGRWGKVQLQMICFRSTVQTIVIMEVSFQGILFLYIVVNVIIFKMPLRKFLLSELQESTTEQTAKLPDSVALNFSHFILFPTQRCMEITFM